MLKQEINQIEIREFVQKLGIDSVGFAPVDCWKEAKDVSAELQPANLWPLTKTVIVLGLSPSAASALATPAVPGLETFKVTNELLDTAAYRLAVFLNRQGYPSVNIPADSDGAGIADLKTVSVFSHSRAAHYAEFAQDNSFIHQESPSIFVSILTQFA